MTFIAIDLVHHSVRLAKLRIYRIYSLEDLRPVKGYQESQRWNRDAKDG